MSPLSVSRLIALAAATGPVFMTGEEGQELVAAGYIVPYANEPGPIPGSCRVAITELGLQTAIAANPRPVETKPVISGVSFDAVIPAPGKRGGNNNLTPRESVYPFADLPEPAIGPNGLQYASFHVAVSADNKEPWKTMASNVSAANRRFEVDLVENGVTITETVTKKELLKDANGPVLDAAGNKQYREFQVVQPKRIRTRKFIARRVNAQDPCGEGVRIFRVPLDFAD